MLWLLFTVMFLQLPGFALTKWPNVLLVGQHVNFLFCLLLLLQVVVSGNQEPRSVELTQDAIQEGTEVDCAVGSPAVRSCLGISSFFVSQFCHLQFDWRLLSPDRVVFCC